MSTSSSRYMKSSRIGSSNLEFRRASLHFGKSWQIIVDMDLMGGRTTFKLCLGPRHSSRIPREVGKYQKLELKFGWPNTKVGQPSQSSSTSPSHSINKKKTHEGLYKVTRLSHATSPMIHEPIHQVSMNLTMWKTYTQFNDIKNRCTNSRSMVQVKMSRSGENLGALPNPLRHLPTKSLSDP